MKNFFPIWILILVMSLLSCKNGEEVIVPVDGYDVILVIGQSNTHQGIGYDFWTDTSDKNVRQLGRFDDKNMKIVNASEPLDHFSPIQNNIGFVMTFAKEYKARFLQPGRSILIIPGGMGGTGFISRYWNKGDTLYNDAVMRTNFALKNFSTKLVAILWHQGESDIGNPDYQQNLDSMIVNIRKDIAGAENIPFILGGFVPYWMKQDSSRIIVNAIIENTVNRIQRTGYANPAIPFLIEKPDNDYFSIHYDAGGMREMGRRYFSEFERIINLIGHNQLKNDSKN